MSTDSASMKPAMAPTQMAPAGHTLSPNDQDSPMRWSLAKKLYTSIASFAFAYTVAFGITSYTAGISEVVTKFDVSMTTASLGFSIPFFGIAFAPIYTPHFSERYGRKPVYLASFPLFALFILGTGLSKTASALLATRFFAGFFGGPCLVLIEGTFADVWSAQRTVTYYSFLTLASFWGAGSGPIIGGFVFANRGFDWLPWITLILAVVVFAFGFFMPETYGREILRRRNRCLGNNIKLPAAQSGVTLSEMANVTILSPLKMLVDEPIVTAMSLYLGLNFAVVFQWFLTVPAALNMAYSFNIERVGLAFFSAIGGAALAVATGVVCDRLADRKKDNTGMVPIEERLYPAMLGAFLIVISLFWIGWTASPAFNYLIPIFGTAIYVWGNMSILISAISYIFDAYPPAGTLSALTMLASFRLVCAGIVPIFILKMFGNLTGAWALSVFGFISVAMLPFPFLLYKFGAGLRARSKCAQNGMSYVQTEVMMHKESGTMNEETRMSSS